MDEPNKPAQEFEAEIYKHGINPCVDVPAQVSEAFGIRGNVPVVGSLEGVEIRSTLVPIGGGRHRLYIHTDMRKRANVDVGDRVHLELQLDTQPRAVPMPDQLARALEENQAAKGAWEALRPSRRKEILIYLNWVKRPETLERNIRKTIRELTNQR